MHNNTKKHINLPDYYRHGLRSTSIAEASEKAKEMVDTLPNDGMRRVGSSGRRVPRRGPGPSQSGNRL